MKYLEAVERRDKGKERLWPKSSHQLDAASSVLPFSHQATRQRQPKGEYRNMGSGTRQLNLTSALATGKLAMLGMFLDLSVNSASVFSSLKREGWRYHLSMNFHKD